MGSSISKLKDGTQKTLLNVFAENKIKIHTGNENSVTFFRHEDKATYFLCKVNRRKLLEKSAFYRAIAKDCYKDHLDDFIEATIPASYEVFNNVMRFINTSAVIIDTNNMLETSHLAMYLQINILPQFCLDHFTSNLTRNTLESQLEFLTKYPIFYEEFKERAEMIRDNPSKSPSVSGFYFLQHENK